MGLEQRQLSEQKKSPRGWQREYMFQEMLPCSLAKIQEDSMVLHGGIGCNDVRVP
jgi:hypothetical protein